MTGSRQRAVLAVLAALSLACHAGAQQDTTTPRGIIALADAGQFEDAVMAARRGGPTTAVTLGDLLMRRGRLVEADSIYAAVLEGRQPHQASALVGRAEIAERRGDRAGALRMASTVAARYRREGSGWPAEDRVAAGRAFELLGMVDPGALHEALGAFDAAAEVDSFDIEGRLRAAALLVDKYNVPDAEVSIKQVLALSRRQPRALLIHARASAFASDTGAMETLREALRINPDWAPSWLLLARFQLEAEAYDSASAAATRALAVDSTDLRAWGYRGAIAWLRGDTAKYRAAERRVEGVPTFAAAFYSEVAEAAARQRRYGDAVALARRAIAADSASARAYGLLAANELRIGAMREGRADIERAFTLDPFNPWFKNTLDLLDNLAAYRTIRTPRFEILAAPEEADYLALYLSPLLEAGYDRYVERYQYRPPTPIRLEVYSRNADFSVRTVGLTGLGALGVSFGPVLAMDGPAARGVGEQNYGATAWHELAHTFTLGVSNNRVPRWISEGLSVLEEHRAGRGWGTTISPGFVAAYKGGQLPPASRINEGLVRPTFPDEVMYSYFLASQVMEMIEAEHGIEAIRSLLRGFAEGLDASTAFQRSVHLNLEQLDEHFDRWLRTRYQAAFASVDAGDGRHPPTGAYLTAVARGATALEQADTATARTQLERASQLFPQDAGPDGAAWHLAQYFRMTGNLRAAIQALGTVTGGDETARDANDQAATALLQVADTAGALDALDRLLWIDPLQAGFHERMATLAEARGDSARATRERRAILALRPADPLEARYQLARVLAHFGQRAEARREVLKVLETAPGFEKAQQLLLDLQREGGR